MKARNTKLLRKNSPSVIYKTDRWNFWHWWTVLIRRFIAKNARGNWAHHQIKQKLEKTYWMCAVHQIQRQVTRTLVNHLLTDSYLYLLHQDMFNTIECSLSRSIKARKVNDTYTTVLFPVWIKPVTPFFNYRPSCWIDRKENKQVLINQLCCGRESHHGLIHYKDRYGTDKH